MHIWYRDYALNDLLNVASLNMTLFLGIEFIELGEDCIKAKMPVNEHTTTPFGLMHGGASCVLAESLGSCASYLCINPDIHSAVGIEINANHIRSIKKGYVIGTVSPIHVGKSIHVWDIRINDDYDNDLICVSRLTTKILQKS